MSAELPNDVRLRATTEADDGEVRRLLAASGLGGEGPLPPGTLYVAQVGERTVGVVGLEPVGCDALMRATCVDPEWRGRGVGSALVEHALTEAALEAMDSVVVLPGLATGFFARFGFVAVHDTGLSIPLLRAASRSAGRPPGGSAMQLRLSRP